jgi:hypothetical protein
MDSQIPLQDSTPITIVPTATIRDFAELKEAHEFRRSCLKPLILATSQFFDCEVKYENSPIRRLKEKFSIDIQSAPKRGVYFVDDATVILLGRIIKDQHTFAVFSLTLKGIFRGLENLLNVFEGVLASTLSRLYEFDFVDRPSSLGEVLIELAIAKYFAKGYYDFRKVLHLSDVFKKISAATLEGRSFTTGLILTRSHFAYNKQGENNRGGTLLNLLKFREMPIGSILDKRFWYLADGQSSFFVANKKLLVQNLFVLTDNSRNLHQFTEGYSLAKTIKGGDALFRVTSKSEFSITSADGLEFNYKEGRWRTRAFSQITELIRKAIAVDDKFVQSFLFFIFYLSKRRLSSIMWIPRDPASAENYLLSQNKLTKEKIFLTDPSYTSTLLRMLSSDGALIASKDGEILSFGSIVDISKVKVRGMKGTGESVATLMGDNGIAAKISQDGAIKLYIEGQAKHILL